MTRTMSAIVVVRFVETSRCTWSGIPPAAISGHFWLRRMPPTYSNRRGWRSAVIWAWRCFVLNTMWQWSEPKDWGIVLPRVSFAPLGALKGLALGYQGLTPLAIN